MEVVVLTTVLKEFFSIFREKAFLLLIFLAYNFNWFNCFIKDFSKTQNIIADITIIIFYWIIYSLIFKIIKFFLKFWLSLSGIEGKYFNDDFVNYGGESRFEWRKLESTNEAIIFSFNRKGLVEIDKDNFLYRYTDKAIEHNYNSTTGKNNEYYHRKTNEK